MGHYINFGAVKLARKSRSTFGGKKFEAILAGKVLPGGQSSACGRLPPVELGPVGGCPRREKCWSSDVATSRALSSI
jgi:hypothetical protein